MSTGDTYMLAQTGRIVGKEDLADRLMVYLRNRQDDLTQRTFSSHGVFTQFNIASPGANQITVTGSGFVTDGLGHLMQPTLCVDGATNFCANVGFENSLAVTYYVGFHYAEMPIDCRVNPTGYPEFVAMQEFIGETGTPSAVLNNGNGTLTFTISGMFENLRATPRYAYVWLNIPKTATSLFRELCSVAWDGVNTKITTTSNFGQGNAPSTTGSDYTILVPGPSIKRNTNLSETPGYAFVGTVIGKGVGNAPTAFSIIGQNHIDTSLADLNDFLDEYSLSNANLASSTVPGPSADLAGATRFTSASCVYQDQIYVLGGDTAIPAGTCSSDHYAVSATGVWTNKTSVPTQGYAGARSGHRALATDTRIYLIGGGDNSVSPNFATNIVQIYDPSLNSWGSVGAVMPGARRDHAAWILGTTIYVMGGYDGTGAATNTFWSYSTTGNSWTTKTAFAATYTRQACAVVNNELYMIGGVKNGVTTNEVWRFDPITDSWSPKSAMPFPTQYHRAIAINGMILVMGGHSAGGTAARQLFLYNPQRDAWSTLTAPPMYPIRSGVFEQIAGIGHYIGGVTVRVGVESVQLKHVQIDFSQMHMAGAGGLVANTGLGSTRFGSGTTSLDSKPTSMRAQPCVVVGNTIYLMQGEDSGGNSSVETWAYYPETNTYERLTDCPSSRKWGGAVYHARDNAIYSLGGSSGGLDIGSLEKFDLATRSWTSITITGTALARNGFGAPILVGDRIYLFGGGSGGSFSATTTCLVVDIRKRTCATIATLPVSRSWPITIAVPRNSFPGTECDDATIYIMGGLGATNAAQNTIYTYDTASNTMGTHAVTLPVIRSMADALPIPGTMKIVVVGGAVTGTPANANNAVTMYDLTTFAATGLTSLLAARLTTSAALVDGMIYMIGGSSGTVTAPVASQVSTQSYDANVIQTKLAVPSNFTKGFTNHTFGFSENDIYGYYTFLANDKIEFVITGDQ